jgi:hypothetical protein
MITLRVRQERVDASQSMQGVRSGHQFVRAEYVPLKINALFPEASKVGFNISGEFPGRSTLIYSAQQVSWRRWWSKCCVPKW